MAPETRDSERFLEWIARPQSLIALSAVLLSVCGLFIAVYEATLIRRQQRASVWPHVEIGATLNEGRIEIRLRNVGVGPARLEAVAITLDRRVLEGWSDLWRAVVPEAQDPGYYFSVAQGRVLPRDSDAETVFRVTESDSPDAPRVIEFLRREAYGGRLDLSVCYCSVYEECWVSSLQDLIRGSPRASRGSGARRVAGCESAPRSSI